jgi:hypothetical protein
LALLQIKHMFADFYLQTPNMLRDRGVYVHSGRAQHCAIHSVGSVIAMAVMGVVVGTWAWLRLPETLQDENRQKIDPLTIMKNMGTVTAISDAR